MTGSARNVDLDIYIPVGYVALPLDAGEDVFATAADVLEDVGPAEVEGAIDTIMPALAVFLDELSKNGVRYCGLGRHSLDDRFVTSVLTVLVYDTGGDEENPRVVVKNLAEAKIGSAERGDLQVIDIDNRPMMFFEAIRQLPTPEFPGNPLTATSSPVYQLEAAVPSEDGSAITSIELSTIFAAEGPHFRQMVIEMARSADMRIRRNYAGVLEL